MSVIFPRLPLMAPPTVEKGTTPIMHPIKRTLALMLTLSLSVSCLPGAALAMYHCAKPEKKKAAGGLLLYRAPAR